MRWMWIDRVIELAPRERLVAVKHVAASEPHLRDHFPADPIMPACLIIEGLAQTAGILVGHANDFREKVLLAKIARATLDADARPGDTLRYTATLQNLDAAGASTAGLVELRPPAAREFTPIGVIDLLFSHADNNRAGDPFPDHNFVFGESFRTLLRMSGVV